MSVSRDSKTLWLRDNEPGSQGPPAQEGEAGHELGGEDHKSDYDDSPDPPPNCGGGNE
jgi:hypothetical protein